MGIRLDGIPRECGEYREEPYGHYDGVKKPQSGFDDKCGCYGEGFYQNNCCGNCDDYDRDCCCDRDYYRCDNCSKRGGKNCCNNRNYNRDFNCENCSRYNCNGYIRTLSGAKFELLNSNMVPICCAKTNCNGEINFCNLPLSRYYIREIEAPCGYCNEAQLIPIELCKCDQNKCVNIFNYKQCGNIGIKLWGNN